jgi:hypothetical protein
MPTKRCSKCYEIKSIKYFYKQQYGKFGVRKICNKCVKKYADKNKEIISNRMKKYYLKNRNKLIRDNIKWKKANKDKVMKNNLKYRTKKLKNNLNFKLRFYLSCRVRLALKGNPKISTTMNLVGCSIQTLKQHLEKQFKSGMNWDNYGYYGWHIDHIKPCANFDLSKHIEQKKCFHYTNLQPLWAKDNFRKGKKC